MGLKLISAIVVLTCSSDCVFAGGKDRFIYPDNKIINIGNDQLLLTHHIDTIFAQDPITGAYRYTLDYEGHRPANETDKIKLHLVPVKLNGKIIFSTSANAIQYCTKLSTGDKYLAEPLYDKMKRYYKRLEKAGYNADIRNIIVNANGDIIYYEYSGVIKRDTFNPKTLSDRLISRINDKTKKVLDKVELKPATIDNKPVAYRIKHYELL